jgi:hypothetical protein
MLYGFKTNVLKQIKNSKHTNQNYYISVYEPNISNIYTYQKLGGHIDITFIDSVYLQDYLLYINLNEQDKIISNLYHIDTELLSYISFTYTRDKLHNKYSSYILHTNKIIKNTSTTFQYVKIINKVFSDIIRYNDMNHMNTLYNILNKDVYYINLRNFHNSNYLTEKPFTITI